MPFIIIGVILLIAGLILFFVQKNQKNKAFCIRVAKSISVTEMKDMASEIAKEIGGGNWREYVKLSGVIECDRPLTSELRQEPCVHYNMSVRREYEERVTRRDSDGKTRQETQRGSEVIASNQQSIPFMLRDQTGIVEVNPNDADIETVKVLEEFRQENAVGGLLSFGGFSLALGDRFMGGGRRTLGYRYCESILPIQRRVTVVGTVSDSAGRLTLQKPDESDRKFIISLKTEEELVKKADQGAALAFYSMLGCLIGGGILVVIGLVAG